MNFFLQLRLFQLSIIIFLNIQYLRSQNREDFFSSGNLASVEIVLLGEQTHGDGAVFDEKVELIKYLHQNNGFNIVAFESGLYDLYKAQELYYTGNETMSIYKQGVYPVWSETSSFDELLKYVLDNEEMMILGFDSQGSTLFKNYFLEDLKTMINRRNVQISEKSIEDIEKLLVLNDFEEYINNQEEFKEILEDLLEILNSLNVITNKNVEEKVIIQSYKNAISNLKSSYYSQLGKKSYMQNPRDEQMADNFFFLKRLYPNEKFILWGANYHFANEVFNIKHTIETENHIKLMYSQEREITGHNEISLEEQIKEIKELRFAKPMGYFLKKKYSNKMYSIAFTSYNGTYLGLHEKIFPVLLPPENSIEKRLKEKNSNVFYTELSNFKDEELYSSNLGYLPILANWSNIYDGISLVSEMYPPKKVNYIEDSLSAPIKQKNTLKGLVLDLETGKPIPYVDIYFNDNNRSSVSDEKGFFSMLFEEQIKNETIISFSGIGYVTSSFNFDTVKSIDKIYLKKDKTTELEEVVVLAKRKLTASQIMKEAKRRIIKNYVQDPYNQVFNYKVEGFDEDYNHSFYEEALINTYNSRGLYGSNTVENNLFGEIVELSYLPDKYSKEKWRGVGDLWITLNKDIVLSKANVLYRTSSYDLELIGTKTYNGRRVYEIKFVNNKPGVYSTGYGYPAPKASSGVIYVDSESYAVLRYEHLIVRSESRPKKTNYTVSSTHKITQTYKEINGYYYINFFQIVNSFKYCYESNNSCKSVLNTKTLVSNDVSHNAIKLIKKPLKNMKRDFDLEQKNVKSIEINELDNKFKNFTNSNQL